MESEPTLSNGERAKVFGCTKCGSPFLAYPPDDIHNQASRESSSFLKSIEAKYVCSKCNQVTNLYWGKASVFGAAIIALNRLIQTIMQVISKRAKDENEEDTTSDTAPPDIGPMEGLDDEIYNYIISNGGAIAVNKASEELGIPIELVKESLERLSSEGRLKVHSTTPEIGAPA